MARPDHPITKVKVPIRFPDASADDGARRADGQRARIIDDPALLTASRRINGRGKRLLDIVIALPSFCFLAPFFLTAWFALFLAGTKPTITKHPRIGRRGRPFSLLAYSAKGKVGALLDAMRLDRLPALVNVIAGDLSLIGPPPVDRAGLESYGNARRYYLLARPGLISPWRTGETVSAPRGRDYVLNWRLRKDVATLWSALTQRRR